MLNFFVSKPFNIIFLVLSFILCIYFFCIYKKQIQYKNYITKKDWYIWFSITIVLVVMLSVNIILTYVYMSKVDVLYIVLGFIMCSFMFSLLLMMKNRL